MSRFQWFGDFTALLHFQIYRKSNRPGVLLLGRTNQRLSQENCPPKSLFFYYPENKIFYATTSEISRLGFFGHFIYCQKNEVSILLNFRVSYNRRKKLNTTTYVRGELNKSLAWHTFRIASAMKFSGMSVQLLTAWFELKLGLFVFRFLYVANLLLQNRSQTSLASRAPTFPRSHLCK